ncbi:putative quinol monooxygenase [Aggregatibacter kilianii]|uniref:putative quinol monooxygenase n=1 Tax=Aggregatibacter kilianii TaxID=2025884 RepID=UPI000D646275|nr:putative quinol monooxygenase [Aggregatibacter kilianii]
MITVIAQFSVKENNIGDFLAKCRELIKHTRQEAGCLSYELQQNTEQANHYVFLEQWKSKADLELHFATPHFTSIVPVLVEYCEQAPVVQTFQKAE